MENQKHCADLFRRRSFTDKFSDTADFVGACWKPLLRILSAVLVPLCLLQTFSGSAAALGATAGKAEILGFSSGLLCSSLLQFIGSVFVIITVYGMMQVYHKCGGDGHPEYADINRLSAKQLYAAARSQMRPIGRIVYSFVLLCAVAVALTVAVAMAAGALTAAVSGSEKALAVVCVVFALLLLLAMPFWVLAVPAYALDGLDFRAGMARAIHYGFRTWGGIVAIMTVFSVGGMAVALPFALLPSYAGGFASSYIIYMVQAVELVALGYQYGHAKAKVGEAE